MDKPSNDLDADVRSGARAVAGRIQRKRKLTLPIVPHDLATYSRSPRRPA